MTCHGLHMFAPWASSASCLYLLDAFRIDPTVAREAYLFHGTNPESAQSICRDFFRMDRAGTSSGTMFGPGIYLAENVPRQGLYFFFVCERFQYSCFSRQPRHAIRVQLRPARAMSMQKKALEFTLGFVLCYFAVAAWVKFLQFPKQGICKKGCETEATTHCVVTGWPQLAPTGRWSFSTRRLCILSSL